MRGNMNGRCKRTAAFILGFCLLTGCGAKESEEQYVQPQGLEALQVILVAPAAVVPEEETVLPADETEPEKPRPPMSAEVTGAEEETLRTLIRAAEVYNSPSVEGTQIGTLKRGERVTAIGPAESAEWIKIEYNGRVAYIESEVLREQAGNTEGQGSAPGQNVAPVLTPTPPPAPEPTSTPASPSEATPTSTPEPPWEATPTPALPSEATPPPTPESTPTPAPPWESTPPPHAGIHAHTAAALGSTAAPTLEATPTPAPPTEAKPILESTLTLALPMEATSEPTPILEPTSTPTSEKTPAPALDQPTSKHSAPE